jgi:hypothetical protein
MVALVAGLACGEVDARIAAADAGPAGAGRRRTLRLRPWHLRC